ncbi:MAG: hypothetical protein OEZ43_07225 [Gammaproteobacteria bacterium]|nr:hypothetical protein [Gammaproteobacteria bacterium]
MKNFILPISVLSVLLVTQSCASSNLTFTNEFVYADTIHPERHYRLAQKSLKEKDYQRSLRHWRILSTVKPDAAEYKNRIRIVEALADRMAYLEIEKGQKLLKMGKLEIARMHFLRALFYQPNNDFAFGALREINTDEVTKAQLTHIDKLKKQQVQQYADSQ